MAKKETRGYIGTYRKPGAASASFDPAGTILEGIESAEKDITSRIKTVRDFENAAATRRQETLDALADTEGMKDFTALDSLQQDLIKEIDELYKLDIASFEGDRSAYLKKQNEMQRVIGDIPALMGLIDQEAELMKENEGAGGSDYIKKYLKSNNEDYYNFVNNASKGGDKISFRIQNGNIIAQLDGKDVFNGNAYIKAKKDGYDLVEYAGDYTKEIDDADARAYKGLNNLVTTEITQKIQNNTELTEEEIKDYTLAKQKYRERLESGQIPLPINESTYQMFTTYGEDNITPYGETEGQGEQTKNAIIDYMVENRFPEEVVTTKVTTEVEKPMTEYQRESLKLNRAKIAEKRRLFEAKGKQEQNRIKDAVDTKLDRNIVHAKEAMALPRGSKQRAQKIVDLLNEARGSKKGAFEIEEVNDNFIVVDSEGKDVKGVDDYIGLLDDLNRYTILDVDVLGKDEVASRDPYVQFRIGESISKSTNNLTEADREKIKNAKTGDEITLSNGTKIRKT